MNSAPNHDKIELIDDAILKNEEFKKIRSRRQATNEFAIDNQLSGTKLQSLGVRYGTLCNSKCMICNHDRSSSWIVDSEKLGYKIKEQHRFRKNLLPGVDMFFDNFDLDDLRSLIRHFWDISSRGAVDRPETLPAARNAYWGTS